MAWLADRRQDPKPKRLKFAAPVVCGRAGFDPDQARR
jgi:hypothetical protein